MRLAVHLGMSVRHCQREVDCDEFLWWRAYMQTEPLLADRNEFMLAQLTSLVANAMGGSTAPSNFMPDWNEPDDEERYRQIEQQVRMAGLKIKEAKDGD